MNDAEETVFKKPLPLVAGRHRHVLNEDEYTEALEKIIQRDFFPDLAKLKKQNEYLEALESNDTEKIRALQLQLDREREKESFSKKSTPATFETPSLGSDDKSEDIRPLINIGSNGKKEKKISLDEFFSCNTSEDNASFEEILEKSHEDHRNKFSWLYEAEKKHKENDGHHLALPSIEEQATHVKEDQTLTSWTYKTRNSIMFVPDGVDLTAKENLSRVEAKAVINHTNTYFMKSPFNERLNQATISEAAQNQAKILEGKVGVDGKELVDRKTPGDNRYSFVRTPSPAPGVDESPLMTWGQVEGTPFHLNEAGSLTPGPSFKMPDLSMRDKLAQKLADQVSQDRAKRNTAALMRSPLPDGLSRSSMVKLANMSPAAQKLATSRLGVKSCDRSLKASYTPTPGRTPLFGTPKTPGLKTPNMKLKSPCTPKRLNTSLTDNLLNLPKRKKALDYFQK